MSSEAALLKDVTRALAQLRDVASAEHMDKDAIEGSVSVLFRRTSACVAASRSAAELCCSALFQQASTSDDAADDTSLLALLQDTKQSTQAFFYVLDYLSTFLKKFHLDVRAAIVPYLAPLVTTCRVLLTGALPSKTRCAASDLAKYIIKHYPRSLGPAECQLHALTSLLLAELSATKCTQSAKGAFLELLGALLAQFASDMHTYVPTLRHWIEAALEKQFTSSSPEMTLISGCFVCLNQLLRVDPVMTVHQRDQLFTYIQRTLATTMAGSLTRLTFVKSCLTLLRFHASSFEANLAADPFALYTGLRFCCAHSNKTIRKPGYDALPNVLETIARALSDASTTPEPLRKRYFQRFLKDFLSGLNDATSLDAPCLALTGLAAFAHILRLFLDENAQRKIHTRLLKYGEDVLALRDSLGSKWLLLCQYTLCFGRFATETETLDVTVASFATDLGCRVLDLYPHAAVYTKFRAELALLSLFTGFPQSVSAVVRHGMLLVVSHQVVVTETTLLYHPETGAPDTRLLFVYEALWKNVAKKNNHIFDASMLALLSLLEHLDVRYETSATEDNVNSETSYQPIVPRDHTILLNLTEPNLTEFAERWLAEAHAAAAFASWVPLYLQWIVDVAGASPLVSAVYRLGRLCGLAITALGSSTVAVASIRDVYSRFISDLVVALEHYQDELLLSACLCVLATPIEWADDAQIVRALQKALVLGLQHAPTAAIAMDVLETWQASRRLEHAYPALLPLLGPYLEANGLPLQRRLLRWLGSLGGHARFVLPTTTKSTAAAPLLAPLELSLGVSALQLRVSLSKLLQPLIDLALHAMDRPTKAAAAEALHAMALLLCGKTATLPHTKSHRSEKTVFFGHWQLLLPVVVSLASDADSVIRALFSTLLFQLVRWFSGVAELYPFEVQSFLNALFRALTNVDGGGRELAAQAIASFLKYAAKQPATSLVSASALFDQLFALCGHPGVTHRLGAALAVEHMYRDFREDDALVQTFALPWTKHLLLALKRQDNGLDATHVTTTPLLRAIDHLEKIVVRSSTLLSAPRNGDAECASLAQFVTWLFQQSASPQAAFRDRCQRLFMVLSRANGTGSRAWLQQYLDTHAGVVDTVVAPTELIAAADPDVWCDNLAAPTEAVAWLAAPTLNNQSLLPDSAWAAPKKKRPADGDESVEQPTRLWAAVKRFVDDAGYTGSPAARSRAWRGLCRLLVVLVEHKAVVPTLAEQWTRTNLSARVMHLLVLSRLDPAAVGMEPLSRDAESVWAALSAAFLRDLASSIAFRSVVNRLLHHDETYARGRVMAMAPSLANGVCALYQRLHALRYWSGLDDEASIIAAELGDRALAYFLQSQRERSPMTDHVALHVLETAVVLGWDLPGHLLGETTQHLTALSLPRLQHLVVAHAPLWLALTLRTLVHVQTHPSSCRCWTCSWRLARRRKPKLPPSDGTLLSVLATFLSRLDGQIADASADLAARVHASLTSTSTPAPFKTGVLHLVPGLARHDRATATTMADALHHLVVHDLPLVSSDVTKGTLAYDTYSALFSAVLSACSESHRVALLPPLYPSLKEGKSHTLYADVQHALAHFVASIPLDDVSATSMDSLHILFDGSVEESVRWRVFLDVTRPLLRRLPAPDAFFVRTFQGASVVATLMQSLDRPETFLQRVSLGLLECLYDMVPPERIRSHVNEAFLPIGTKNGKGNELTMRLCKAASTKIGSTEVAIAAYRCLLMTVRKTQTQEKFYTQLLFPDTMWSTILAGAVFELTTETNWKTTTRREALTTTLQLGGASLSSQFLEGSSLSQTPETSVSVPTEAPPPMDADLDLEHDVVNAHPCMQPLLQTLVTIETLFQSTWSSSVAPAWMEKLRTQLQFSDALPVRTFILKLVLNRPRLFAPYAAAWLGPMTDAAISLPHTDQFHYLLRDVCHLLLSPVTDDATLGLWTTAARAHASDMSSFVNHLVRVSVHASAWILRDNLYLIETALRTWSCYAIDVHTILSYLTDETGETKAVAAKHTTGLHLTAMLVSIGFLEAAPNIHYQAVVRSAHLSLEDALLTRISGTHKATPALAADVAGRLLHALPSIDLEEKVQHLLVQCFQNDDKPNRCLMVLKQLSAHVPSLVLDEAWLHRLQSILPRVWSIDALACDALDILVHALQSTKLHANDVFFLLRPSLPKVLGHRSPLVTQRALAFLIGLWPDLPDESRAVVVHSADASVLRMHFDDDETRRQWFEFLMSSGYSHVHSVQSILLRGLTDANECIRSACVGFWAAQLPSGHDRLLALASAKFQCGDNWVRYVPTLWLQSIENGANKLFDAPLSASVVFEPMRIDTAWAARTQGSLTPLFSQDALTLQSQPVLEQQARLVKATQERAWSQTQSQQYVPSTAYAVTHGSVTKRFSAAARASSDSALSTSVKDKLFFTLHASRIKQFASAQKRAQVHQGADVPLYRSYRAGELPDIEIARSDVLRPLLAVAELHAQTATLLLCALLTAFLEHMPATYATDLATHLTGLLAASPDKAVLVASVQECLLTLVAGGGIDPTIVGAASVASLNVVTGQLLLEELVLQSPTPSAWTELQHVLQVVENEPLRMAVADVLGAIKLYDEAEAKLQANVASCSPMERQRWATERMSCIAQLNKWDALTSELVLDDVWSLPEPFRGQQVRHLVMAYGATDQAETLLTHMTPERVSDVTRTCPELFGFLQLQGPRPQDAMATVEHFFAECVAQWTSLPTCYRLRQLQRLPLIVHLESLLCVHAAKDIAPCLNQWAAVTPRLQDDALSVWSAYYWSRTLGYERLTDLGGEWGGLPDLTHAIATLRVQDMLTYAHAAVSSNVLALASRLLSDYRQTCTSAQLPKLSVYMVQVYVAQVSKLATRTLQQSLLQPPTARAKGLAQVAQYYVSMLRLFENDEVAALLPTMPIDVQRDVRGLHVHALASASSFHQQHADAALGRQWALDALERFDADQLPGALSSMHGPFLSFLDKWVEHAPTDLRLGRSFVTSVLHGMAMADEMSAKYLPRVLDLVKARGELLPLVTEKMAHVPMWTCLHWSAQIVALLQTDPTPFNELIRSLLEKLATEYPRALYFDFALTSESMALGPRFDTLRALLKDASMDQFVAALNGLHHPEIRFKEGVRQLLDAIETQPPAVVTTLAKALVANVLDGNGDVLGHSNVGAYNRSWAKTHRKSVEAFLAKPTKASLTQARAWIASNFQVIPGKYGIDRQWKAKVADFSEWLSRLDPTKTRLELPGQYTSRWAKPEPTAHATILSCDPQLLVLASKQLPKRITFHASNGASYQFLVKGGEDLRLDQRIEQLFEVMSTILQSHPSCQRRNDLAIRTYKVVPMTTRIGLVEWLGNTTTLKTRCSWHPAPSAPRASTSSALRRAKSTRPFGPSSRKASFHDVVPAFEAAQALLPPSLFRRRLLRMASSPDAFFTLRSTFQGTLAAFNGASYILGIGDRHLDNFLLDTTNGSVIGIDFGISFGAGASLLPVPELIPFRFTRQMEGVSAPYDGRHLLQMDLAVVLEALRENQSHIDSVMNVFLHEPLLEWQAMPKKTQKKERKAAAAPQEEEAVNLATTKMRLARDKLLGKPPRAIVADEVRLNPHVAPVRAAFEKLLACENPHALLSPLDQAQALIELATDPNILGRTFHGWSPWA
ncbi:hypothetical protein SPRG_12566 [Saprolegnia parasitica CBS 223.65]|uniref:Uncharacterized protein n=1 Tax=Saprolegnia parasitica (strain CBS 223.65) TaxID=695850 RepID=A0A067C7Q8_SAPPC|nr:hypothetical protein SPRG_12566 [Saprolegnia parasitica CBS 223.65]KDO22586.1 hypothetical protein SPRG_12566 [Saprolegnia parasitica CBS 223.65]|eukprot:XP_012206702.1 hypothetical protein SPRG_12566 [Saprolegnia parasitica CBS 223.65]